MASLALGVLLALGRPLPAQAAAEPMAQKSPHGRFKEECALCHSAQGWTHLKLSARFDHGRYGMPLDGAHRTNNCTSCHTSLDFTTVRAQCVSCHQDPHRGEQGSDCGHCHNTRSFTDRSPMLRAHQLSNFPLTGSHALTDCNSCHKPAAQGQFQYAATPTACVSCHMEAYRSTLSPDHAAAGFPTDCKGCHETRAWGTATFNHAKTAFSLTGSHVRVQCQQCHAFGAFRAMSTACASCHAATYASASPPHSETGFPSTQCSTCHNTTAWVTTFNHAATAFPLTGAHVGAACAGCHGDGSYKGRSTTCYSCHQNSTPGYATATNPPHTPANFPTTNTACTDCHNLVAFSPSTFPANHSTTAFAANFKGAHLAATCTQCHNAATWNVQGTGNNCYGCHATDYANTLNPKHDTVNNPIAGCTCHSTTAWSPATGGFDHLAAGFPLTGSHSLTARVCNDCHAASGYGTGATNPACYSCHATSTPGYNNAGPGAPVHNAQYFPSAQCTTCHAAANASHVTWAGGTFTHPAAFPLANAHAGRLCQDCHKGNYTTLANNCYSCHQNSTPGYATVVSPPHTPANFPTTNTACTGCHNLVAFSPSTFPANHSTTAFAANFKGAHLAATCTQCHNAATWNVQGTGNNCYGCHATDYANTLNPKHDTVNNPIAGCTCHSTTAWSPATGGFDHLAAGFPLTGSHSLTARVCNDCHAASGYGTGATNPACYSCHATSTPGYNNAGPGAPVHNAQYFPSAQCTTCHAAANASHVTWAGGTFTHPAAFPLANAHAGRLCQDCHKGNYTTLANNCYSCHQNSTPGYATVVSPPHTPANFPTTNTACTGCHNLVAFSPSTFPANHSTTAFAANFKGAHLAATCTQCHNAATWNVQGTGSNCYGCHATDYANTLNPKHDTVNFPTAGCTCHTTTAWAGATAFDHASVGFSMTGSHSLGARLCSDCHNIIGYTAKATDKDCITCHATDYSSNGILKHTSPNFPTATTQCITCHSVANTGHVTWQGGKFTNHAGVTTSFALTTNHNLACNDCHTAAGTDLKQWTCSASCHSGNQHFGPNGSWHSQSASRAGYVFSVVVKVESIKECYYCHPTGRP